MKSDSGTSLLASDVRRLTSDQKRLIHVVAAIIHHPDRERILLAKRPDHLHQGGLWEFPGGKVDASEVPLAALHRELEEELAIAVVHAEPFLEVHHDYPEKAVFLDIWQVWEFTGTPMGNEGQQVCWVAREDIGGYDFPAANQPILDLLLSRGSAGPL